MSWDVLGRDASRRRMDLLVSSMSARGRALEVGPRVVRLLREGGWRVDVTVTTPDDDPGDLAALAGGAHRRVEGSHARRPAPSPAPFVGALGGDGYVSAIAEGVSRSGAVLVPIPGGRGNDLCRAIGVGADPLARARDLGRLGLVTSRGGAVEPEGRVRAVDGIWVERSDGSRRLVLGVVSFGLEAIANALANESWFRSGPLAYAYGAVTTPLHFRGADFTARIDGVGRDMGGWVLSVSNSGYIGGGINVVPSSDAFDGTLEVLHVGRESLRAVIPALLQVVSTRNADHPLVHVSTAREVVVDGPVGTPVMADGDQVGHIPLRMSVAAGVVRALV